MNCVGCFECMKACPHEAIVKAEGEEIEKGFIKIDRAKCRHCPQLNSYRGLL